MFRDTKLYGRLDLRLFVNFQNLRYYGLKNPQANIDFSGSKYFLDG